MKSSWKPLSLALLCALAASQRLGAQETQALGKSPGVALVHLLGEEHGNQRILEKEFEVWKAYYARGMRHLFVELPYYTGEFLNLWLAEKDDALLDQVYADWEGTLSHNAHTYDFYRKIKAECPQTIFHGTDVGHQYDSTGLRYLRYLEAQGQGESQAHQLAAEAINQGQTYYRGRKDSFRENAMAWNFMRELDLLPGVEVLGIYGSAHTGLESLDVSGSVPSMAAQLRAKYGDRIESVDLGDYAKDIPPLRYEAISLGGRDYRAAYFGRQELRGFKDFAYRDFWRLEEAYGDFKGRPRTGDLLPYGNYPMKVETGQVFVIEYRRVDGTTVRLVYISPGQLWKGRPTTVGIQVN